MFPDDLEREPQGVREPAPRVHRRDVHSEVDDRLCDRWRDAGQDRLRSEQTNGLCCPQEMVGNFGIDDEHACDIDDDHLGLLLDDLHQHRLHQLVRAMCIDGSD